MVLHLGAEVFVSAEEVVAVLNIRTLASSEITREFLASEKDAAIYIAEKNKSVIITRGSKGGKIYYSPISAATLLKRVAEKDAIV